MSISEDPGMRSVEGFFPPAARRMGGGAGSASIPAKPPIDGTGRHSLTWKEAIPAPSGRGVRRRGINRENHDFGRRSQAVRQRSAKPPSPVRIRSSPPVFTSSFPVPLPLDVPRGIGGHPAPIAWMAELVDARDLKSLDPRSSRFDSGSRHLYDFKG